MTAGTIGKFIFIGEERGEVLGGNYKLKWITENTKDCKTKNFLQICLGQTLFFFFQGRDISFYSTENFQPARFQNKNQFEICAFCVLPALSRFQS